MSNQLVYIDGEPYHADDFTDEELAHYGVAGMKWGKRRARKKGVEYKYKSMNTRLAERKLLKAELTGKNVQRQKKLVDAHRKLDADRQTHLENRSSGKISTSYGLTLLSGHPAGYASARGMQNTYRAGRAEGNSRVRSSVAALGGVPGRIVNRELNARRIANNS